MAVHLCISIKKLDSTTDEEFHEHWSTFHPQIWLNVGEAKEQVVSYSQFCVTRKVTSALTAQGLPVIDYDGGVNIGANSVGELMAVVADAEYHRLVVPDEESIWERQDAKMMIGHKEDMWAEGKLVACDVN